MNRFNSWRFWLQLLVLVLVLVVIGMIIGNATKPPIMLDDVR